ncbi:MAG: DUF933 domain-containing protein [Smithella sp.]|nr:DUF933 domain-containing protein [Smithella sp.]
MFNCDDFITCDSSAASVKSAGRLYLEGKEHIARDGDTIAFRINI